MLSFASALSGAVLDAVLGEPSRWHPLVGFGHLAGKIEQAWNGKTAGRGYGLLAWVVCVIPPLIAAVAICRLSWSWVVDAVLLYFALGARSLGEHVLRAAGDLEAGELQAAREHVGWIVSRQTAGLSSTELAKATVESVLENGNDAIFGALFWFALLGGPGALLFRLANTLDAMWGYRNERYLRFGWAAARIDDALNFIPARLTALTYAFLGNTRQALRCWRAQAPRGDSPNAGPVMAAGAGALGVRLGGAAVYHGQIEERPVLGAGHAPSAQDIRRAVAMVRKGLLLWLSLWLLAVLVGGLPLA